MTEGKASVVLDFGIGRGVPVALAAGEAGFFLITRGFAFDALTGAFLDILVLAVESACPAPREVAAGTAAIAEPQSKSMLEAFGRKLQCAGRR